MIFSLIRQEGMENCKISGKNHGKVGILCWMVSGNPGNYHISDKYLDTIAISDKYLDTIAISCVISIWASPCDIIKGCFVLKCLQMSTDLVDLQKQPDPCLHRSILCSIVIR